MYIVDTFYKSTYTSQYEKSADVTTYALSEDEFVDIPCKHGGGREYRGVGRRHDGCRHGSQPEKGYVGRGQMLENHGQDHPGIVWGYWQGSFIVCFVPIWQRESENSKVHILSFWGPFSMKIGVWKPTGGFGNRSDQDWWHSHQDAAQCCYIGYQFSSSLSPAGQDPLEVNLKWTQGQWQPNVHSLWFHQNFVGCLACHGMPPKVSSSM